MSAPSSSSTHRDADVTIAQLWRQRCKQGGDKPALRHKNGGIWVSLSWRAFLEQARAIGSELIHAGLRQGEVVSILSENRPEWLVVDMAVQAIGCICHGIYPNASAAGVAHAIDAAGASIIFVENAEQLAKVLSASHANLQHIVVMESQGLRHVRDQRVTYYGDWLKRGIKRAEESPYEFDERIDAGTGSEVSMLVGTAGATGAPRLVAVTSSQFLHRLNATRQWLPLQKSDSLLSFISLSQVSERLVALAALFVHDALLHFPESPATVLNDLVEVAPQVLFGPPRFWEKLHNQTRDFMHEATPFAKSAYQRSLHAARPNWWHRLLLRRVRTSLGLRRLRMAVVAGASICKERAAWYEAIGVGMFSAYVVAEAAGICSLQRVLAKEEDAFPDTGLKLALDEKNEILVGNAGGASGYWQRGNLVAAADKDWIRTGDVGIRSKSGIRLAGRLPAKSLPHTDQPVLAESAEDVLRSFSFISDAVVVVQENGSAQCLLSLDESSLRKHAQEKELPFSDYASLVALPEIAALMADLVRQANQRMPGGLKIEEFRIIPKVIHPGDDSLTPVLRLNRHVVLKKYFSLLGTPMSRNLVLQA